MNLFIPISIEIFTHYKIARASRALKIADTQTVGHLVALWIAVLRHRKDGVLHDWNDEVIANAAQWDIENASDFVSALVSSGLLDVGDGGVYTVRNWHEHAGRSASIREAGIKRQQRYRDALRYSDVTKTNADVTRKNNDITSHESNATDRRKKIEDRRLNTEEPEICETEISSAAPARISKREKKPAAKAGFETLLEQPYQNFTTSKEFFTSTFPAFDGKNGRLDLDTKLAALKQWYDSTTSRKAWKTPVGIHQALARDYNQARSSWERDQRPANIGWQAPMLTPEQQRIDDERRTHRNQEQLAKLDGPVLTDDDKDAAREHLRLLRGIGAQPQQTRLTTTRDTSAALEALKAARSST